MRDVISLILMLIGSFFMFVAAVGVARMPDLFLRMSATSKSATLGAACILLAAAVHFNDFGIITRAVATIAFLFLTAPVAAHRIRRATTCAANTTKRRISSSTHRSRRQRKRKKSPIETPRGHARQPFPLRPRHVFIDHLVGAALCFASSFLNACSFSATYFL
jgi:multicomponent Na+:H+ antiporter subunit G